MFKVSVPLRAGDKSVTATGPGRALAEMKRLRECYGVEATATDGERSYSEADLESLLAGWRH